MSKPLGGGGYKVARVPWRKSGVDGWFFDRRATSVYANDDGLPVFSAGLVCASDGFNLFSLGGRRYSINATYLAMGCLSPTLLRRLRSWNLCSLGAPSARWEEEVGPLMSIISLLQNGCRARVQTDVDKSLTAMVRMGLLTAQLDSPMHSAWSNTKCSNWQTKKPCPSCTVTLDQLGDENFDVVKNRRTADGLASDLAWCEAGATPAVRASRSRDRGVVVPASENPIHKLIFDLVRQFGIDILHQDAINAVKNIFRYLKDALNPMGLAVLAGRVASRPVIPPNVSPVGDITSEGAWAALTGQEMWTLASIAGFLFHPIFVDHARMSDHIRNAELLSVAERIGVDLDTTAGKKEVCTSFQNLLKACSESTFAVRSPSFTDEGLRVLERAEKEQVKQTALVMGASLGTFHKGLHISQNIRDLGAPTNTNAGESKHKELKKFVGSGSGRDNLEHTWRTTNDPLALKALADGVRWTARGWDDVGKQWVTRQLEAGPLCQEVLHDVFEVLPLAPADANDDDVKVGRPFGYVQWEAALRGEGVIIDGMSEWGEEVAATLPTASQLEGRYAEMLACGRSPDEDACFNSECSSCLRNRGRGLTHRVVTLFNHFAGAVPEVSAGTGTIRGGAVKDVDTDETWAISTSSRGSNVEIYVTREAQGDGMGGVGFTTLGKVAYFFEHRGNDLRREDAARAVQEGVVTVWVAVQEYVTAARGHKRKVDKATGCDVFTLRRAFSYYPVSAILRVVHMVHACPTSGAFACGLVDNGGKRAVWRCALRHGAQYLLNKYFHSLGRAPLA